MEITIVTWNIAGAVPLKSNKEFNYEKEDYLSEDVDYFVEELKKINPDLVCLQESHTKEDRSIGREIGDKLGFDTVRDMENSPSHIDPGYKLGNSIVSKIPVTELNQVIFHYPDFPLMFPDGRP